MSHPFDEGEPPGSINFTEAAFLREQVTGKVVLELGAMFGFSTASLCQTARWVVSTDQDVSDVRQAGYADNTRPYDNLTTIMLHTQVLLPRLRLAEFDVIFHDADHYRDTLLADLGLILGRFAGQLIIHDYGADNPGVKEACDELGLVPTQVVHRLAVFTV